MGFIQRHCFLLIVLQLAVLLLPSYVKSDEEEDLFKGLNSYRDSLNLRSLTKNKNAECFAEEVADEFKDQPCSNTIGYGTVPGNEPQFTNYEGLLDKCHLTFTNTRGGAVLPVCVPNLVPYLVLTNFTETRYNQYLSDSRFTGVGIASKGDWMVVVMSTDTADGSYSPAENSASLVSVASLMRNVVTLFFGLIVVQLSCIGRV